jgi:hypothetical protein
MRDRTIILVTYHSLHVQIGTAYTHGYNTTFQNQHAQHADVAYHHLQMRNSLNQVREDKEPGKLD